MNSEPGMNCAQLITDRLIVVPFSEEHLTERYVSWLNDPEVVQYSEQRHKSHTMASCREYFRGFSGSSDYFWAVMINAEPSVHIGNITATVDRNNAIADVAILLGEKEHWGKGYGSEVWIAVCEFLLGPGGIRKVTAGTMSTNTGMLNIMKNAGMFDEGRRKANFICDGIEVDLVMAARFQT